MLTDSKYQLLDFFCGAGGAAKGYQRSGFYVVGVDIAPQPHYCGDGFVRMDALEVLRVLIAGGYIEDNYGKRWYLKDFDAIHASPPCQGYSDQSNCWPGKEYPRLIADVRTALEQTGKPFVIENVPGARRDLNSVIFLCGSMFGLKVYRHRYFESSFLMMQPWHIPHNDSTPRAGRGISPKGFISVAGHMGNVEYVKTAMGIDWTNGAGLAQAIPPVYTEFIGKQLMEYLERGEPC